MKRFCLSFMLIFGFSSFAQASSDEHRYINLVCARSMIDWAIVSAVSAPSFLLGGLGTNFLREGGHSAGRVVTGTCAFASTIFFGGPFIGELTQFFSTIVGPSFLAGAMRTGYLREMRYPVQSGVLLTAARFYTFPLAFFAMSAGWDHFKLRLREQR